MWFSEQDAQGANQSTSGPEQAAEKVLCVRVTFGPGCRALDFDTAPHASLVLRRPDPAWSPAEGTHPAVGALGPISRCELGCLKPLSARLTLSWG